MDSACVYKVGSFLLIEAVQIWNVLEVVCIEISALYNFVWLYIIIKYSYLKVISLFLKNWLCCLKNLRMRCLGSCYCDGFVVICCEYNGCSNGSKYKCSCCLLYTSDAADEL